MATEEYADVKVKITFGGSAPMQIERTQRFVKTANGLLYDQQAEHRVWYEKAGNWKKSSQPAATVNSVLPKGIRQFFFFEVVSFINFRHYININAPFVNVFLKPIFLPLKINRYFFPNDC